MRHFLLTMGVFLSDEAELPDTFESWLRVAFGDEAVDNMGASVTTLEQVVETKYPLAKDVVSRRRDLMRFSPSYH